MKILTFVAFAAILFVNLTFSQKILDTVHVDTIDVKAYKFDLNSKLLYFNFVSELNFTDIEKRQKFNSLDLVSSLGAFITQKGVIGYGLGGNSAGKISIRGISGNPNHSLLVLINGVPYYQGIFGHPIGDVFRPIFTQKIQLAKGSMSTFFGSNAMGGVVNIETHRDYEKFEAFFDFNYASFNTYDFSFNLGSKFKKSTFSISADFAHSDGVEFKFPFNSKSFYTNFNQKISAKTRVLFDLMFNSFDDEIPSSVHNNLKINANRLHVSSSLIYKTVKSLNKISLFSNFGIHNFSDGWFSRDLVGGVIFSDLLKVTKHIQLSNGLEFLANFGYANNGQKANEWLKTSDFSIYSILKLDYSIHKILAGARLSSFNFDKLVFVPTLAYKIVPVNFLNWKFSYSKGYRNPTLMELYLFMPNKDLKPEFSDNYDISMTIISKVFNISATYYYLTAKNIIVPVNFQRVNTGSFKNQGLEFEGVFNMFDLVKLSINYNYSIPSDIVLKWFKQRFISEISMNNERFYFLGQFEWTDKFKISNEKIISYSTLNLASGVKLVKQLWLKASINNLFNEKYVLDSQFLPVGRTYSVGISYIIN